MVDNEPPPVGDREMDGAVGRQYRFSLPILENTLSSFARYPTAVCTAGGGTFRSARRPVLLRPVSLGSPVKRRSASAMLVRPLTPVITTSTIVKDAWKWPRACSCSTGTPAAPMFRHMRYPRHATDRTHRSPRKPGAGQQACRGVAKRAGRCDRRASSKCPRTSTSASASGSSPSHFRCRTDDRMCSR
jgi:hypothetical protein